MIKFNSLVHKQTGTVIKYDEWLKEMQEQKGIIDRPVEKRISKNEILNYRPKQAILSDDFEIIYDSEFTIEELFELNNVNLNEDLRYKLGKLRIYKKKLKDKYGIEV